MRCKQKNDKCVLSLALPPLPPASPTTSLTSSLLPSLLLLDPSHRHHPHYRVLVELALAVHHTVSLGSLDPHALVHLPCHR